MTVVNEFDPLSIEAYQSAVRGNSDLGNTLAGHAQFITGEVLEILAEHGRGQEALIPKGLGFQPPDEELQFKLADEIGDSYWYGVDMANLRERRAGELCAESLSFYTEEEIAPFKTFTEQETAVIRHAGRIAVINKMGLYIPDERAIAYTSLENNPGYLLTRTATRLTAALGTEPTPMPPGASAMEEPVSIEQAVGDHLNVLSYIASTRLGIGMSSIARFNLDKLRHRSIYGKGNDL